MEQDSDAICFLEIEQGRGDVCQSPSCPVIALVVYSLDIKVYFSLLQV